MIVTGVKPGETGSVEIDDYVRFSFESPAGTAGIGTIAYLEGDASLAEVSVDLATGRLRGATLVIYGRTAKTIAASFLSRLPISAGLPLLSAAQFDHGEAVSRVQVIGPFDLLRGPGIGLVQLHPGQPDRMIQCGAAVFPLVGDTLWGFGAIGLSEADVLRMTG